MTTVPSSGEITYAEALLTKYEGKMVEVLFDSDWGAQHWHDYDIYTKPIMIGKFVSALSNCIDMEVEIESKAGKKITKIISVNSWSILSVSEYDPSASHIFAFTKQIMGKQ